MNWLEIGLLALAAGAPTLIICASFDAWTGDKNWTGGAE
jgi:hypothetical protein